MRDTQKMNQRSASYHFNMHAGEGSEIVDNADRRGTVETRAQWGSPLMKNVRQTNTSVVQQSRKLNLSQSLASASYHNADEAAASVNILGKVDGKYKCTCQRSTFAPRLSFGSQFPRAQIHNRLGNTYQSARVHHESQSVADTPNLTKVFSAERLSSLIEMPRFNSQISELKALDRRDANPALNVAPLQTQTDILESIADEDAPMKVVHGESAEPKLTEVNQSMPVIPAAFRSEPPHVNGNLQAVMNM